MRWLRTQREKSLSQPSRSKSRPELGQEQLRDHVRSHGAGQEHPGQKGSFCPSLSYPQTSPASLWANFHSNAANLCTELGVLSRLWPR